MRQHRLCMRLKISKDTMIGELVMNCPQAVEILYEHGFHCIGCGLSAYETLEQGALAHGYDEETIKQIVKEIQEKVNGADKKDIAVPPGANVKMKDEPSALALSSSGKKAPAKTKKKESEPG